MRIGIITSRTARPIIETILSRERLPEDVEIVVLDLPVPAVGVIEAKSLARIALRAFGETLSGLDLVILPGLSPGRPEDFTEAAGVPAVKGPRDPGRLPHAIRLIARGVLAPGGSSSYEEEAGSPPSLKLSFEEAFRIGSTRVPLRGPPLLVATELSASIPLEDLPSRTAEAVSEGADLILVGASNKMSADEILRRYRIVREESGMPVLCETGSPANVSRLAEAGCEGFTLSAGAFTRILQAGLRGLEGFTWVVGDRQVSSLARASMLARRRGVSKLILDPVVGLPLIDFSSTVERYRSVQAIMRPTLFSAANALGEMSADPHGAQLLLASLAAELGASVYLVVEDGWALRHSTAEARHAVDLVAAASSEGRTPRSPWSRLLVVRQEHRPPGSPVPLEGAEIVGRLDPIMEESFFVVGVDHGRGLIIVEYRDREGVRRWAGRDPRSLMRAVLRSVRVSREHAGYLGFELYNAWLALRTGKTYLQDEPVIVLPWEAER